MRALRNILNVDALARRAGIVAYLQPPLPPEMDAPGAYVRTRPAAVETERPAPGGMLKNMALFLAAPFVGLAYAMLLPLVGFGMLAYVIGQALWKRPRVRAAVQFAGFVGRMVAAPFIGLAWFLLAPVVGLTALAWVAVKAVAARR